jgi:hypothetical protein
MAPCVVVLEDLDAMIHDQNTLVFLNELDGFQPNTGVVVLATHEPCRETRCGDTRSAEPFRSEVPF